MLLRYQHNSRGVSFFHCERICIPLENFQSTRTRRIRMLALKIWFSIFLFANTAIAVLIIYMCLFADANGPSDSNAPVSSKQFLHGSLRLMLRYMFFSVHVKFARYIQEDMPAAIRKWLAKILGKECVDRAVGVYDHISTKRNPFFQIIYLIVINGAYLTWLTYGHPLLPTRFVSERHHYIPLCFMIANMLTFYWACTKDPGIITCENIECYRHQPYDDIIFADGNMCKTCKLTKV